MFLDLDYQLEAQLDRYLFSDVVAEVTNSARSIPLIASSDTIRSWLSKERFLEHSAAQQNPRHFFQEYPKKQSNNDMQYHADDTVLTFLVNYFYLSKDK